jgi:hypothetical protein
MFAYLNNTIHTSINDNKEENLMSKYTESMIATLRASAPLDLQKAHALAEEWPDVGYRSIIAKAKSLGLEYIKAEPAAKKAKDSGPTKAAILASLRARLALPEREGDLTKAELETLLEALA